MLESQADRTTRTRSASLDEANNYVRSTETQRGGRQARVFGKPLASMFGDFASALALLQNSVEFLDVGWFWKGRSWLPHLFQFFLKENFQQGQHGRFEAVSAWLVQFSVGVHDSESDTPARFGTAMCWRLTVQTSRRARLFGATDKSNVRTQ
jgi:hypothetical protein